mmetsp:Transcript_5483/g.19074  ORF Transcript_5483/g.19074 Transcript_5483/m.19074 type:complete len:254 (-) Transcript_5483:729-1490(-)
MMDALASHDASGLSGRRSAGGTLRVPTSTKGRKGSTTASSRTPSPGVRAARSSPRSSVGRSHRSRTLRSAAHRTVPPGPSSTPSLPASRASPPRPVASKAGSPLLSSLRTIGALASVASTASNSGASLAVTYLAAEECSRTSRTAGTGKRPATAASQKARAASSSAPSLGSATAAPSHTKTCVPWSSTSTSELLSARLAAGSGESSPPRTAYSAGDAMSAARAGPAERNAALSAALSSSCPATAPSRGPRCRW